MPTYEYRCGNCGHQFEKLLKITDESSVECPRCDGLAERLISGGAGLLFKGSGFYITDYRSESYKQAEKKDSKPAATSSQKGESSGGEKQKPAKPKPKKDSE
jgi:putative FmdB family regulatory protein